MSDLRSRIKYQSYIEQNHTISKIQKRYDRPLVYASEKKASHTSLVRLTGASLVNDYETLINSRTLLSAKPVTLVLNIGSEMSGKEMEFITKFGGIEISNSNNYLFLLN